MSVKNQLMEIIDCIPEKEQILLYEIAKHFVSDDTATEDDLSAIQQAREEYENGETINYEKIDWD